MLDVYHQRSESSLSFKWVASNSSQMVDKQLRLHLNKAELPEPLNELCREELLPHNDVVFLVDLVERTYYFLVEN